GAALVRRAARAVRGLGSRADRRHGTGALRARPPAPRGQPGPERAGRGRAGSGPARNLPGERKKRKSGQKRQSKGGKTNPRRTLKGCRGPGRRLGVAELPEFRGAQERTRTSTPCGTWT